MGERLIQAFALEDPGRFAQLLGASHDIDEAVEILNRIPDGSEGEVLTHLSPEAADRLLSGLPDDLLGAWLGNCPTDVGRRLLARIGTDRSAVLLERIKDPSKRRALRRKAGYPSGSIGAHMRDELLTVTETASAEEVEESFREQHAVPDCPAIILGADERVLGFLDVATFVGNQDPEARAAEFCIPILPVHAEAPLSSLRDWQSWQGQNSLPVVDHRDRLVGYVTRTQMETAAGSIRRENILAQSAAELSARYLQFLAFMMSLVFSRRVER